MKGKAECFSFLLPKLYSLLVNRSVNKTPEAFKIDCFSGLLPFLKMLIFTPLKAKKGKVILKFGMAAIHTFDWFKDQVWSSLDEGTRRFLLEQRDYLLKLRNEDERRRFVEEVIEYIRELKKKKVA